MSTTNYGPRLARLQPGQYFHGLYRIGAWQLQRGEQGRRAAHSALHDATDTLPVRAAAQWMRICPVEPLEAVWVHGICRIENNERIAHVLAIKPDPAHAAVQPLGLIPAALAERRDIRRLAEITREVTDPGLRQLLGRVLGDKDFLVRLVIARGDTPGQPSLRRALRDAQTALAGSTHALAPQVDVVAAILSGLGMPVPR